VGRGARPPRINRYLRTDGPTGVESRSVEPAAPPPSRVRADEPPVVSVVWAVLNERSNLPELVRRLRLVPLPSFEVVVVDDGSTDGTREYLTELAAGDPRFRVVFHNGRQTTVRAQAQAIQSAHGRFVIVMDADLQHPPEVLPAMVRALEDGASLVVGSRYAPGGAVGERTWGRYLLSKGAEWLARIWIREVRHLTDPVSGLFGFRREIYRSIDPEYRGYKLLLFVAVMSRGEHLAEVPFRFDPRTTGASKVTQGWRFVRLFLGELSLARRTRHRLASSPRLPDPVPAPHNG